MWAPESDTQVRHKIGERVRDANFAMGDGGRETSFMLSWLATTTGTRSRC